MLKFTKINKENPSKISAKERVKSFDEIYAKYANDEHADNHDHDENTSDDDKNDLVRSTCDLDQPSRLGSDNRDCKGTAI